MGVETIEPEACELPAPMSNGQGRQRLNVDPVREWLWEHPGEWCRLVGANDRAFTSKEVEAIRAALASPFRPDVGSRRVSIQTRPSGDGRSIYARLETDAEWQDRRAK